MPEKMAGRITTQIAVVSQKVVKVANSESLSRLFDM